MVPRLNIAEIFSPCKRPHSIGNDFNVYKSVSPQGNAGEANMQPYRFLSSPSENNNNSCLIWSCRHSKPLSHLINYTQREAH